MTTTTSTATPKSKLGRRTIKKLGRDKRKAKVQADKEFAKTLFAGKSKRSAEKKVAFRKKKSKK
jgi:hypothetical protein